MPRKRSPFIRPSADRDARLIIIAAEDTKATVRYFERLASPDYYQNSKVHVEVLRRDTTASAPDHVLRQLDEWRETYDFGEGDEFWLVIDVDQWGDQKLSLIAQNCVQKSISLAVSNPAIELWFLLHHVDVGSYSQADLDELQANERVSNNRTRLEQEIVRLVGRYNKSDLRVDDFLPHATDAVRRAEALDHSPTDRWPQTLGTRIYLLVNSIRGDL